MPTTDTPVTAPPASPVRSNTGGVGMPLWMPLTALALMLGAVTYGASSPIRDPDAWWHLRVGALFWDGTFTPFATGPLSAFATEPWIPRDWVPQLVASKAEDWFGLPGVAWLYGASLVLFVAVGYLVCRRTAAPLPAVVGLGLCLIAAAGSLSQRPQMVSFVLLFVVVGAWLATVSDLEPRWWLIPLTWVWANSHGMWYFGIAVGVIVTFGLLIDRRTSGRTWARIALIPVLSVLAAALTPAGPALLLTAFQTSSKWTFVTEWGAPEFLTPGPAAAMLMVCIVAVTWARRSGSVSWTSIGLLMLATAWVLLAQRTVSAGAIVLAPLVAAALQSVLYGGAVERPAKGERWTVAGLVAACLLTLVVTVPSTASTPGGVPDALNSELEQLPSGTPVLNEYVLGGWLHWRHPDLETVIDGFTDGYSLEAMERHAVVVTVSPGWEDYIDDKRLRHALLGEDSPLAYALEERLGWTVVGSDKGYVLLEAAEQ